MDVGTCPLGVPVHRVSMFSPVHGTRPRSHDVNIAVSGQACGVLFRFSRKDCCCLKPTFSCVFQWQVCVRCTKSSWTCDETQSWDRRKWKLHQLPEDCIRYRVSFLTEGVSLWDSQNCFGICSSQEVTLASLWKSLWVFRLNVETANTKKLIFQV